MVSLDQCAHKDLGLRRRQNLEGNLQCPPKICASIALADPMGVYLSVLDPQPGDWRKVPRAELGINELTNVFSHSRREKMNDAYSVSLQHNSTS